MEGRSIGGERDKWAPTETSCRLLQAIINPNWLRKKDNTFLLA